MPDSSGRNVPSEIDQQSRAIDLVRAERGRLSRSQVGKSVGKVGAQTAIGAIPVVGPVVTAAWTAVEEIQAERQLQYIEDLTEATGDTVLELQAVLQTEDGLSELFVRAMNASAEARSREKIKLLAGIVADARRGNKQTVDLGHTMLGVVEKLEPLHMQVLAASRSMESPQRTSEDSENYRDGVKVVDLADHLGTRFDIVKMVCEDMHSQNLLVDTFAGTYFAADGARSILSLTPLARELLQLLDAMDDELRS